ncbi:MAG: STAS domain-containing protein [Deltaproteobacteria bacterium]|nr:STAS domain-containing protein [Candidatus Anaeroferrophillus wilburensis]MBN2889510.1 STAS domain-containing protein [Deltaproteobacteria bacterium]
MKIEHCHDQNVSVVRLAGELTVHESAMFQEAMIKIRPETKKQVIFNFQQLSYIDSSGLGALVSAFTSLNKNNCFVVFCCLSDKIRDIFHITKLETIFTVYNQEADAVEALTVSQGM